MNVNFEVQKIKRLILRQGKSFTFIRHDFDLYGKELDTILESNIVNGVFHIKVSYVSIVASDASKVQSKSIPYVLCLYSEKSNRVQQGDVLEFNNKKYRVTGKTNILELNYAFDISLEVAV